MAQLGRALTELEDPLIRALFVYASNPMAVAPDSARVRKGLSRPDLFTDALTNIGHSVTNHHAAVEVEREEPQGSTGGVAGCRSTTSP